MVERNFFLISNFRKFVKQKAQCSKKKFWQTTKSAPFTKPKKNQLKNIRISHTFAYNFGKITLKKQNLGK